MARSTQVSRRMLWCGLVLLAGFVGFIVLTGDSPPPQTIKTSAIKNPETNLRGSKWGYDFITLLHDEHVRNELAVSPGQASGIDAVGQALLAELKNLAQQLQIIQKLEDRPSQAAAMDEINDQRRRLFDEYGVRASEVLNALQRRRLTQIVFQVQRVEIFYYDDVASALHMSNSQRMQVAHIRAETVKQIRTLRKSVDDKSLVQSEFEAKVAVAFTEAKRQAIEILADDQRQQFDQMHGAPIQFAREDLRLELRSRGEQEPDDAH